MSVTNQNLVVGVFEHLPLAERAIQELWETGFPHDRIDMITRSEGRTIATPRHEWDREAANGAIAGAGTGAAAGAAAGVLATMLLPGVGLVLGGGLLAALGGAALGAAAGAYLGPFVALGMSSDEAHYYANEIDEGRTLVLVQVPERAAEAEAILRYHGGRIASMTPAVGAPV